MKKLLVIVVAILYIMSCFAQKDVTKFLGFPVDGTQSEMIKNLKSKGFKLSNVSGTDVLTGRLNGYDVNVYISTENGKVSRIKVCDKNTTSDTDIKIRFNRLCRQFKDNGKYLSLKDYTIPEDEDLADEMAFRNKRYDAIFFQLPEEEAMGQLLATILEKIQSKYTPEQLESPSEDFFDEINLLCLVSMMKSIINKPVWFKISEHYGNYYITMYYVNVYNRANSEDL